MEIQVGHLHWGWCWSRIIHTAICGESHARASGDALRETAAHGEPMREQNFSKSCSPWRGAHAGGDFLSGTVAMPDACDLCRSRMFLKDSTIWKGPMLGQFLKNCSPWEGPILEKFKKNYILWEGTCTSAINSVKRKQQQRGIPSTWLQPPIPLLRAGGGG